MMHIDWGEGLLGKYERERKKKHVSEEECSSLWHEGQSRVCRGRLWLQHELCAQVLYFSLLASFLNIIVFTTTTFFAVFSTTFFAVFSTSSIFFNYHVFLM